MGKKGFTLIELLAVIVLLGIVMVIAIPGVGAIKKAIDRSMLEKKALIIEEAASLFGEDIRSSIINSNTTYNNLKCKSIIVSDLVSKEYLNKDNENDCLNTLSDEAGCIVNPSDNTKYLDYYEVIIYYQNRRIRAILDLDDNLTCE